MPKELREDIVNGLLSILVMKNTPDTIAIDCKLKAKYAQMSPWPFEGADEAAACFRDIIEKNSKTYGEVNVSIDNDILTIALNEAQGRLSPL